MVVLDKRRHFVFRERRLASQAEATKMTDKQPETATRSPKYPMKIIEGDGQDIDEFLAKYAPSSNQATVTNADGETVMTDWIWCRRAKKDDKSERSELLF